MICRWLQIFLIVFVIHYGFAQLLTADVAQQSAEEIANKTYVEEQSELQRFLFKSYNRKTWDDEMAVWDPTQFNNVRSTIAKQWDLWQPDLRVANSVSGVNQYFEISKRFHTTLTSLSTSRTKVEVYPTFAVKIGCHFDYSNYPTDMQSCAMRLYTTQLMNEIELHIYYGLNPSVMLGWGDQAAKRHINDWELLSVSSNLSYYNTYSKKNGNNKQFVSERPSTAEEMQYTWSLVLVWIELRRNAGLFWAELALPLTVATLINIGSFAVVCIEHAILVVLVNLFAQSVCIGDSVLRVLPPVVGSLPRIALFANVTLVLTCVAIALHIVSLKFAGGSQRHWPLSRRQMRHFWPLLAAITPNTAKSGGVVDAINANSSADGPMAAIVDANLPIVRIDVASNDCTDEDENEVLLPAVVFRNLCALLYSIVVLIAAFIIFVV